MFRTKLSLLALSLTDCSKFVLSVEVGKGTGRQVLTLGSGILEKVEPASSWKKCTVEGQGQ